MHSTRTCSAAWVSSTPTACSTRWAPSSLLGAARESRPTCSGARCDRPGYRWLGKSRVDRAPASFKRATISVGTAEIMTRPTPHIPALRFDWLTRFYDPILRAALKEEPLKRRLSRAGRAALGTALARSRLRDRDAHDHVALPRDAAVMATVRRRPRARPSCRARRARGCDSDTSNAPARRARPPRRAATCAGR